MAGRLHHVDVPNATAVRGYLDADRSAGASAGAPVWNLDQERGRTKVIHNSFNGALDITTVDSANPPTAGNNTLVLTLLGALPVVANAVTINGATNSAYMGLPVARFVPSNQNGKGGQWVQASTINTGATAGLNNGVGASLAGLTAKTYDPYLQLTFVTELGMVNTNIDTSSFATGLLSITGFVLSAGGLIGGVANGIFFRIPQGTAGVSSPIECIWVVGGVIQQRTITNVRYTAGAVATPGMMRFAIRVLINRLSAVAAPVLGGNSSIEYWINDTLVATHSPATSTGTSLFPLNIGPGICIVRINGTSAANVPYWTYTIGPVRAGATNS